MPQRPTRPPRRWLLWPLALAACLALPPAAAAQHCTDDPCPSDPPEVHIDPGTGSYPEGPTQVFVEFYDDFGINPNSRRMTFNGNIVTSSFTAAQWGGYEGTLTLNAGTNTFSAYVCDTSFRCTTETVTWTGLTAGVRVTPDGDSLHVPAGRNAVARFTVTNTGSGQAVIGLGVNCTGVTSCVVAPAGLSLAAADSGFVDVSFTAPAAGTGVVGLSATSGSVMDGGTMNVRIGGAPDAGFPFDAQSLERIERSECVVIGLGGATANECGDLRVVHPLPAARSLNKERTPVLYFNSIHARPYIMVAAHLAPRPGARPDTIRAYLTVGSTTAPVRKWAGWSPDTTKRVVAGLEAWQLPTGIYTYRVEFVAEWNGSAARDTLHRRTGRLVQVNHNGSAFGAGWWLAGLERLHVQSAADSVVLWVGGDGSARIYRAAGANRWEAAGFDRPDVLTWDGVEYSRWLPGQARVVFDGAGYHRRTENRLGHVTHFRYNANGTLGEMVLPTGLGQPDSLRYAFEYGTAVAGCATSTTTGLTRVGSPAPGGGYRYTTLCADPQRRVHAITDPDGRGVAYGYESTWLMNRRTDRRGGVSMFIYGDRKFGKHRRVATAGDTLTTTFNPGAALGFTAATPVGWVYLSARDPRGNSTYFHLGSWGIPKRVDNALGQMTWLERGDARWPARVTRVVEHNGFETTATYDGRGNLSTSTAWNPYDDGRNATTTYRWNPQWDDVTQVTAPEGEVTLIEYDALGRRAWEQPGADSARRVRYTYNHTSGGAAPGLLESVTYPGGAVEQYAYDGRGNLLRVTSPLGISTTTYRDRVGRPVVTETPAGSVLVRYDSVFYDVVDQVDSTVTRAGSQRLVVNNQYDEEGNLRSVARRSDPDPAGIGTVTTQYVHDLAGRRILEIAPDGMRDSTVYDRAGNPTEVHTRRTDATGQRLVIRNQYDNANRLIYRYLPEVRYNARDEGLAQRGFIMPWEGGVSGSQPPPYPWYPNDGGTGYLIPADTVSFNYDTYGRLRGAYNREARIRRDYYRNGALRADTLTIRTWAELGQPQAGFTHQYALELTYDRNGRRTSIKHPQNIAPLQGGILRDRTSYTYDRQTGALATVTDPLGTEFRYGYNVRGEVESLSLPGGITERYRYDMDGRLALHTTENLSGAADRYTPNPLRRDTLGYDAAGKMLFSRNMAGAGDTLTAQYSAMGHLAYSRTRSHGAQLNNAIPTSTSIEEPQHDALGNQTYRATTSTFKIATRGSETQSSESYRYHAGTGRLRARQTPVHRDTLVYDGAGNLVWETYTSAGITSEDHFADRAYFYDAAGQLRASDTRNVDDPTTSFSRYRRSFEEYRYDALGRRVLVRARRDCYQPPYSGVCELGWIRRTVWDGDQELYEIQQPGGEQTYYSQHMENDTFHIQLAALTSEGQPIDPNTFYGRVLYTHGVSLDHPLGVIRMGYGDLVDTANAVRQYRALDPYVIVPHWNSRGQPVLGSYVNGAWRQCQWLSGYKRCNFLQWPEMWAGYARANVTENAWHGTLLVDKGDASGLSYRRNRYYDPGTGRFTQEDPIGLAGGLNAYGFPNGDPVNYSDPYGLCDPMPQCLAGLGSLRMELNNAVTGARQWASNARQTVASLPGRTRLYVRSGAAHLNSQFEIDGRGRPAIRTSEGVSSNAATAQLGVSVDLNRTPDDAVGTVRTSRRLLNLGVVRVSGTGTAAVSEDGTVTPLTAGVEIGRSVPWKRPSPPWSGSGTTPTGCVGPGCDKH